MKKTQASLFEAEETPLPEQVKGDLVLQATQAAQTPLEREFARLLSNIEHSSQENKRLEQLLDTYRYRFSQHLQPLQNQEIAAERTMVQLLHNRLQQAIQPKDLTAKQRQAISRIIVSISHQLALEGDAQMQAIHDQYSPMSMDDEEQEAVDELVGMMEELGLDTRSLNLDASRDDVLEALQKAALAQHETAQAAQVKRQAKQAARKQAKAAADPKLQAKIAAEQAVQKVAQSSLRDIYRQLARQLHPDRATSDTEREQHHDLMSQVNAAYDKQDLLGLLKLQLQAQQLDSSSWRPMPDEQLRGFNAMLKQQVKQMHEASVSLEMQICAELGLPPLRIINEKILESILQERLEEANDRLDQMKRDLQIVQTDAGLKRWVKSQIRLSQEPVGYGML